MKVYVINKDGSKLMPCNPAKARKLLRDGLATSVKCIPFTIQLEWDCEENIQKITIGIDKGSHTTGYCAIANGEILMSGYINHRTDIKKNMQGRATNRRQRRSRLWYRKRRFNNRSSSKRAFRLPVSIKANVEEVIRTINQLPLPIKAVVIEDVQIDIARLNDAKLNGKYYQQSNRLHENLRLATLIRDNLTCQCCKAKKTSLEAHHIHYRKDGGSETINNLITVCSTCHSRIHDGTKTLKKKGVDGFKDQIAQRTMQGKIYLYSELNKKYKVTKVYGYETSAFRKEQGLPKDHDADALAVATLRTGEVIPFHKENFYTINFRATQTRRQFHFLPKKGKGRVRYQVNSSLGKFSKGDIVLVKGKYLKQINSIYSNGVLAFKRVLGEPFSSTPKNCRLLERQSSLVFSSI